MRDLSFGQDMPRGYVSRQDISKEVWSARFFHEVEAERASPYGVGKLVWKAGSRLGEGVLVMASRAQRVELIDDFGVLQKVREGEHLKVLRKAVFEKRNKEPSILSEFLLLVVDTEQALKKKMQVMQGGYNFKDLIEWQKSFHLLTPITSEAYINNLVTRLERGSTGAKGNGVEIDKEKLANGVTFKMCSCENGKHYGFCLHSCIEAMQTGLIKGYPPNFNPTRIAAVKHAAPVALGRPGKAVRGGALGRK